MTDWLNYHHLYYFWVVAHDGNLTRASRRLRLSPSTVSAQIHALEESLGYTLLEREGRGLSVTVAGRAVISYADEIFRLGGELQSALKSGVLAGRALHLRVGLTDSLPKLIAARLLALARSGELPTRVTVTEASLDRLVASLAAHEVDLVLADAPALSTSELRVFNHLLGECGVGFFGTPALADSRIDDFPRSLEGAPLVLPTPGTPLRTALEAWFDTLGLKPDVVMEVQDGALLKAFGEDGVGLFPAPLATAADIERRYGVRLVGAVPDLRERFYAITMARHLEHPAARAIAQGASMELFGSLGKL